MGDQNEPSTKNEACAKEATEELVYICLYIYTYIYLYRDVCIHASPKNFGRRYIVGVDVLDLTHINFRKVGFDYTYIDIL